MAQLPIDEAIVRFKDNEDKFDAFVNLDGTYITNEVTPRAVQTLPSFMDEMVSRYYAYSSKGYWTTTTIYEKQDLVVEGGVTYLCLLDHTSATFATDLSSGKWAVYQGLTRDELASPDAGLGAELIEYAGQTVEDALDARVLYSDLSAPEGADLVGYKDSTVDGYLNKLMTTTPFGLSGMRVVVGDLRDAHYGWGGVVAFPSGKWVHIYRKGDTHGISDNSELRARDSYDLGSTWTNDRLLYQDATHDARPDAPRLMANNRMGFFINRQDEGTTHFSPMFFKSDDEGVTFSSSVITTTSPYTFQAANGGILDFPASQGGHNTLGFISYGYLSAVGLDAFTTVDNGNNWSIVTEVATPSGIISAISENIGVRVGTQDKWIFFCRSTRVDGQPEMTVFVTTNMLNWGTPLGSGVDINSNPPGCLYDSTTNKIHLLNFARAGRGIDGFENHLLHIEVDADDLYNANGSFSTLGLNYSVLTAVPSWATGYITPFKFNDSWYATFTCGETGSSGGDLGLQILIGDFSATSADVIKIVNALMRHQVDVHSMSIIADDNATTSYPLSVSNLSKTAKASFGAYATSITTGGGDYTYSVSGNLFFDIDDAIFSMSAKVPGVTTSALHIGVQGSTSPACASYSASTASRKHFVFHNLNGEVGSISTSGTATAFTTSSDETWKDFIGEYDAQKAIDIIKADPVRDFNWKPEKGGGYAIGWGAQTSYTVSHDLATPGGWFKDGVEVVEGTEGAVYVPWGVDNAKRTPYLWAAVGYLVERLTTAEKRIALLEETIRVAQAK